MKSSRLFIILFAVISLVNADNLTISQAYDMALSNSKNIKSSLLQLEANRENITQAKSGLYPQLSLYGNYGKNNLEVDFVGFNKGIYKLFEVKYSDSFNN